MRGGRGFVDVNGAVFDATFHKIYLHSLLFDFEKKGEDIGKVTTER